MASPSLRPLSVGEILDAGIKVCTRHWKALSLCVIVPVLPLAILQVLILTSVDSEALELLPEGGAATADDFTTDVWVTLLTTYGFGLITFVVVNTVCFKAVADAWLGAEPNAGRSLRFGAGLAPKIILLTLVWVPVMALASIPCGIPAVWLGTVWSLSLAAVMFERASPFKALGRSYTLIQQRFWATLLLILVSFLLVGILGGIVSAIPSVFAEVLASENELALAVANVVGTTLGNVITYPYSAAVLTILYFDQRVRKEGFDVQMLAEGLGAEFDPNAPLPAPLEPSPYAPPPPPQWQPQGEYGGWSTPSHQTAPLRWGPGAQQPPDDRPPDESPWMRPTPGGWAPPGEGGQPPSGPGPDAPPRWAGPSEPDPEVPPRWAGPSEPDPEAPPRWARPSEPDPDAPSRWARPSGPDPDAPPPDESGGSPWTPPSGPGSSRPSGLESGSPLADEPAPPSSPPAGEAPPREDAPPAGEAPPREDAPPPAGEAPPREDAPPSSSPSEPEPPAGPDDDDPSWESRWGGSSPFGESPWEDKKDDKPKKDKDRADWQPPEEPRGPGGL